MTKDAQKAVMGSKPSMTGLNRYTSKRALPVGGLDALDRVDWEGGPAYYSVAQSGSKMTQAAAMGWSSDTFFPIAVFLSDPNHASELADVGINTYVGTFGTVGGLNAIRAAEPTMSIIPQANEFTDAEIQAETTGRNSVVGLMVIDEPELNTPSHADYMSQASAARTRANTRNHFLFTNFAHNIRRTFWRANSVGGGLLESHEEAAANDVICADHYCYTSPGIRGDVGPQGVCDNANFPGLWNGTAYLWPGAYQDEAKVKQAAAYGWQVKALRSLCEDQDIIMPIWITIETQMPFVTETGRSVVLYNEMKGAVWSAIVNEARGIMYFQHNGFYDANDYSPGVPSDSYTGNDPNTGIAPNQTEMSLAEGDAALRTFVTTLNSQIIALAPVINTQSYVWDFTATGIETMLKAKDGYAYIFATKSVMGTTGSKTFTLPAGITGATAEVLHESRSVSISGGAFTDTFANEYTVHIYKVAI